VGLSDESVGRSKGSVVLSAGNVGLMVRECGS